MPTLSKTLFTWKNFFALFSSVHLGIFTAACVVSLLLTGKELGAMFTLIANVALFALCLRLATIIHECGHFLVALAVSAKPERMVLGLGHEVARIIIGEFKVIINNRPIGGYVVAPFQPKSFLRLRIAAFTLGGVAANMAMATIFYFIFGVEEPFRAVDFSSAFIIANALYIYNLIPFFTTAYGSRLESDGLTLIKLPFRKLDCSSEAFDLSSRMVAVNDLLEQKQWAEAIDLLKMLDKDDSLRANVQLTLATALYKVGDVEESLHILNTVEAYKDEKWMKPLLGLLFNAKACIYLEQGNIEQAHYYAYRAYVLMSRHPSVMGTYGSTLVERGDIDQGIQLLLGLVDFRFPNSNTLSAAIYVMLGYGLRKNYPRARRYRDFVDRNRHLLDRDEKVLYDRCLAKLLPEPVVTSD